MLQALVERYETECKEGRLPRDGWEYRGVLFALVLSEAGDLLQVMPLAQQTMHGKKQVNVPRRIIVPMGETRASGICPFFLCDNSSYFLGMDEKGKAKRTAECFAAAKKLHEEVLGGVQSEAARAVLAFFERWQGGKEMLHTHPALAPYAAEISAGANLVFRVARTFVHEDPAVCEAWEKYLDASGSKEKRRCLVTGALAPIAVKHPALKGVTGAQATGAMLVSFNANAYESYGHDGEQGGNAPVSKKAAFAYGTALNALLADREHTKIIGDTTMVYWAEEESEAAQDLLCGMLFGDEDKMTDDLLDSVLKKVQAGAAIDYEGVAISYANPFYILGLAPNAARLSVRFFLQGSFGDFLKNLALHMEQMKIVRPSWETRGNVPLWELLRETVNPNAKVKMASPIMAGAMLRAVLTGGKYPVSVFQNILLRIHAEQGERKINARRAGFLKAYLMRNRGRKIAVALDENSTVVAYLLGRWFAVLEEVQEKANPEIKATIRDRFFDSACGTPAHVFPMLQKLALHHLKKLETAPRVYLDKKLSEIMGKLDAKDMPRHLPLEEQGVFILGYYHQKQKRYEKKEEK
ncbi:type I-C CRISPR-associated protein Cas8c/Csd1 [uncultured Selenomonas sp.]|uniref:type I-C CRISPR-associated protein Cas8c/Csd1 n=1 Tax=uncultured Selenomonas sp. TaxID=159275 RepID=UPI0028D16E87|nr:type I-C CRISPR-associated protein Cas8c/Csd1 [uncultured Selenomonas sp.]